MNINVLDVVHIAKLAGGKVMAIYQSANISVHLKADQSPLTEADQAAHHVISTQLTQLNQTLGLDLHILSEESKLIEYTVRQHWDAFWMVDPLDGTKEFLKRNEEFTVNIALIHQQKPILGVVYAPALNECFWAHQGSGTFKNGIKIPSPSDQRQVYRIATSRSHISHETQIFIDQLPSKHRKETIPMGSSLKLCRIAEGVIDAYPRLGPTMEWDIAAAHAILTEANKNIHLIKDNKIDQNQTLAYNKPSLLNPYFLAC